MVYRALGPSPAPAAGSPPPCMVSGCPARPRCRLHGSRSCRSCLPRPGSHLQQPHSQDRASTDGHGPTRLPSFTTSPSRSLPPVVLSLLPPCTSLPGARGSVVLPPSQQPPRVTGPPPSLLPASRSLPDAGTRLPPGLSHKSTRTALCTVCHGVWTVQCGVKCSAAMAPRCHYRYTHTMPAPTVQVRYRAEALLYYINTALLYSVVLLHCCKD